MPRASAKSRGSKASSTDGDAAPKRINGVQTGVGFWWQVCDDATGRFFFYHSKTKKVSWSLPLRDAVPEEEVHGLGNKLADSDWTMSIDPQTGKKFYESKKINRIQWKPPLMYRPRLMKLPYFQERRVSLAAEEPVPKARVSMPKLKRQASIETIINSISIESVLDDSTSCSAFHRYLVSVHAEENLLFWATCEVFRLGKWKGMKTLGIRAGGVPAHDSDAEVDAEDVDAEADHDEEDEGEQQLQEQLERTRASVRIGLPVDGARSLNQEARTIYDRFIRPGAPLEICIDAQAGQRIIHRINAGDVNRELFLLAQEEVLRNMEEDLLPRFLQTVFSDDNEVVGQGEFIFSSDEVVRRALTRVSTLEL
ncbi:Regulator of G-protein signaling 5 [Hondaea fermentalgiana]|uniref:Regulator of G-protein signaling 5 n=1 Tax=Hondaea fermentalgiana TaxID=2315210 RepID=A0A2R5GQF0_9STRA|nr:Regulator of G-protein signaling 5 [Hondaea fermentalgiana]|eukprot:GBG32539.1 Regulator of G-protein signaling 5 [Hondaea fermentalgiana]